MKATEILHDDHQALSRLLTGLATAKRAATRARFLADLKRELGVHAAVEEKLFYPVMKSISNGNGAAIVAEALEEREEVKGLLAQLAALDPRDEDFPLVSRILRQAVEDHSEEQESRMFPLLEEHMSDERLEALGRRITALKSLGSKGTASR